MKCIKIRKCYLKLPSEMSGLMNAICYPTWRQPIKFLSQGKYSFNQSHKTTFLMYPVIKSFIKVMDEKSIVCVHFRILENFYMPFTNLTYFYWFPVKMEMFMLNF